MIKKKYNTQLFSSEDNPASVKLRLTRGLFLLHYWTWSKPFILLLLHLKNIQAQIIRIQQTSSAPRLQMKKIKNKYFVLYHSYNRSNIHYISYSLLQWIINLQCISYPKQRYFWKLVTVSVKDEIIKDSLRSNHRLIGGTILEFKDWFLGQS